jgi:hypothetical protein
MTNKTLVERELRLTYLNNKITQKQKELKTKYLDINNLIENARIDENKQQIIPLSFLKDVKKSYDGYYNNIIDNNNKKKEVMEKLTLHLNDIIKENGDANKDYSQILTDQNKILGEISRIKQKINNII